MNCVHFNGWDWSELADAWGIYIPEGYGGVDMYEYAEKRRLNPDEKGPIAHYINEDGVDEPRELFDGIDWSVNNYQPFNEYDPVVWYIIKVLGQYEGTKPTRVMMKMANDVRCFAKKLSESEFSYLTPLWKGMSEIEDDWSLLSLITDNSPLLASMWD